jgi:hypothetical protein
MAKIGRRRVEEELAWSHSERAYLGVYQALAPLGGNRFQKAGA